MAVNTAKCESKWSSKINKVDIIDQDRDFHSRMLLMYPDFYKELMKFRKAVLTRDLNHMYEIRTDLYKKTVTPDYFVNKLMRDEKFPSEVYFSFTNSKIQKDRITIRAFYVMIDPKFTYCNESNDQWKFDQNTNSWRFVGNQVSWGSPIVIE